MNILWIQNYILWGTSPCVRWRLKFWEKRVSLAPTPIFGCSNNSERDVKYMNSTYNSSYLSFFIRSNTHHWIPNYNNFDVAYRLAAAMSKTYSDTIVFIFSTSYLSQYSELGNKPRMYENLR